MAIRIPDSLIDLLLFGTVTDRRQFQDSPILGDVWFAYARQPDMPVDVLIAPFDGVAAARVASAVHDRLRPQRTHRAAELSFVQGLVAGKLRFCDLLAAAVPMTYWWFRQGLEASPWMPLARPALIATLDQFAQASQDELNATVRLVFRSAGILGNDRVGSRLQELPALPRVLALAGLILWAGSYYPKMQKPLPDVSDETSYSASIWRLLEKELKGKTFGGRILELRDEMAKGQSTHPLIYDVSLNRRPYPALTRSVPAVKAAAARRVFSIECRDVAWAILDSGIDAAHPAFLDTLDGPRRAMGSRVRASFDFQHFRKIVNLSNKYMGNAVENAKILVHESDRLSTPLDFKQTVESLQLLAADAEAERPIHWDLVRKFVEIKPGQLPPTSHGTHVAGILGASRRIVELEPNTPYADEFADGMCPDISLYDFRVLGLTDEDSEFAIIAALQFIRHLNDCAGRRFRIDGVNLSLSIPHNVKNYACGKTPICVECERLVDNGVVVVAAAGNHGYVSFQTPAGLFNNYTAFSITDPGNSDLVLTVGATHGFAPHTYGVSYFSSRGPTGDGRMKPDLLAPGEKIHAPIPGGEWGELDGTSMAAPHVSGAAAMLMAQYPELKGQPRQIKRILCESATDLGRERSLQGHGMLDVLRAMQSF
jgi:serine protease AprX